MQFNNKVSAIVTGGASGLGKATTELIIENGGKIAILDRYEPSNDFSIIKEDKNTISMNVDVSKEEQIKECFELVYEKYKEINLVVNCAGIGISEKLIGRENLHSSSLFQKVVNVNLVGTFNTIKEASNKMQNNNVDKNGFRGVIINTSSIAAYDGQIGQVAYSASKGGVVSLTLPVARELARYGIRVCTIAPGLFKTPMLEKLPKKVYENLIDSTLLPKRLGFPTEFAKLVKAIYENDMLNGETIRLDGSIRLAPK